MDVTIALRNSMLSAVAGAINAGSGTGKLRVYAGDIPATVGDITTQQLLLEAPLAKPAHASIVDGFLILKAIPEQMIITTGIASFAVIVDGDGSPVMSLSVGVTNTPEPGDYYDLPVPTTQFIAGAYFRIPSGSIRV